MFREHQGKAKSGCGRQRWLMSGVLLKARPFDREGRDKVKRVWATICEMDRLDINVGPCSQGGLSPQDAGRFVSAPHILESSHQHLFDRELLTESSHEYAFGKAYAQEAEGGEAQEARSGGCTRVTRL